METGRRRRRFIRRGGALACTLLMTLAAAPASGLPPDRGWELVSPAQKNGGQVDPPETIAGGGVLQAAAGGGAVTFSSRTSFGPDAVGSPPASQYVSTRSANGWATANITPPIFSGTYDLFEEGVPYRLFSPDLGRGVILNGDHCRGDATGCAVANPPLAGTDAPAGYQNYYLREGGGFTALLGASAIAGRGLDPTTFDLRVVGASPDLTTIVISTCAALTDQAADGCGTDESNLYRWSQGSALSLINTTPGAELAAKGGAVSADGNRVYWKDLGSGNLYLREGAQAKQVDGDAGGEGVFETASEDGSVGFYTKGGHLWRYAAGASTDLTPAGGVVGVLGASSNGTRVYYQDGAGLKLWSNGSTTLVAPGATAAAPSTFPPSSGTARVSSDGTKLLFVSKAQLTGYDNTDLITGEPDSQVFLYDANADSLTCISCNPGGKRPIGPSTIPGAHANGSAPGSIQAYKPRALSANGKRVFFDSADSLVASDSNSVPSSGAGINDVYLWEAQGEGTCTKAGGCVAILSHGPSPSGARFADASADGADAFFLTEASLVGSDPGSTDLYDARVGGGFPEPTEPIPCEGDACQLLPPVPSDPTVTTLLPGAGNPPVQYRKYCRRGYVKRKGICVKRGSLRKRRCRKGFVRRKGRCVKKRKRGRGAKRRGKGRARR